jgi:hypothetical protein
VTGEPAQCVLTVGGMYAATCTEAFSFIHDIFWQCIYLLTTYAKTFLIHFSFNICAAD